MWWVRLLRLLCLALFWCRNLCSVCRGEVFVTMLVLTVLRVLVRLMGGVSGLGLLVQCLQWDGRRRSGTVFFHLQTALLLLDLPVTCCVRHSFLSVSLTVSVCRLGDAVFRCLVIVLQALLLRVGRVLRNLVVAIRLLAAIARCLLNVLISGFRLTFWRRLWMVLVAVMCSRRLRTLVLWFLLLALNLTPLSSMLMVALRLMICVMVVLLFWMAVWRSVDVVIALVLVTVNCVEIFECRPIVVEACRAWAKWVRTLCRMLGILVIRRVLRVTMVSLLLRVTGQRAWTLVLNWLPSGATTWLWPAQLLGPVDVMTSMLSGSCSMQLWTRTLCLLTMPSTDIRTCLVRLGSLPTVMTLWRSWGTSLQRTALGLLRWCFLVMWAGLMLLTRLVMDALGAVNPLVQCLEWRCYVMGSLLFNLLTCCWDVLASGVHGRLPSLEFLTIGDYLLSSLISACSRCAPFRLCLLSSIRLRLVRTVCLIRGSIAWENLRRFG